MSTKLYVGNLSYDASESSLSEEFSKVGQVKSVKIVMDQATGRSRGFAFIEMETPEAAQSAIEAFDGKENFGRTLRVNLAKERSERPPRSFGGGGGGGGGRGFGGGGGGGRGGGGGFGGNRDGGGGGNRGGGGGGGWGGRDRGERF